MKKLTFLFSFLVFSTFLIYSATSSIVVTSNYSALNSGFVWAKNKALSFVLTSKTDCVIPSYSAAMDVNKFCPRDAAHQLLGAYLLGLENENYGMMNVFAWGANRRHAPNSTDYYWPRWHYAYNIDPLTQETQNGITFGSSQWRTLPTATDMIFRCYQQFLWSGKNQWINGEFWDYYQNLFNYDSGYIKYQDFNKDGILDEEIQLSSYYEFPSSDLKHITSGDAIGCQYQAMLAYSEVLKLKGQTDLSIKFKQKADSVKTFFETYFYNNQDQRYMYGHDRYTRGQDGFGKEAAYFMGITNIGDNGARTDKYLDYLYGQIESLGLNIEAQTYLPEVFYNHNHNSQAWHYLKKVLASQDSYPEVSFTCVSNIINGLMGINANAPDTLLSSLPRLDMIDVKNITVNYMPFAGRNIKVAHDGNTQTTLTLNSGDPFKWKIMFQGNYPTINIDGVDLPANIEYFNGKTVSTCIVKVSNISTPIVAKVSGTKGSDLPVLTPVEYTITPQGTDPAPGIYPLNSLKWVYGCGSAGDHINIDKDYSGKTIMMSNQSFSSGLGCRNESSARYELNGHYVKFMSKIGYNDLSNGDNGAVRFIVCGGVTESKVLFISNPIAKGDGYQSICVDVTGLQYIVIGTLPSNSSAKAGYVNWADPQLVAKGTIIDTQAPNAPTNLVCTSTAARSATIAWDASIDNGTVAGYYIYQNGALIGSTTSTTFEVKSLAPSTSYNFQVKAYDTFANLSGFSNTAVGTTKQNDPETYLSDIDWNSTENSYRQPQKDASTDGASIKLGGETYPKGLGCHATSSITYNLYGQYYRFTSYVGLDDEVSANTAASVVFQVYADGALVYQSPTMHPNDAKIFVDLNITNVNTLKLVMTDAGDGINSDHGDWAMAKIYYQAPTSVKESTLNQESMAYPNPFVSKTTLTCQLGILEKNPKILIYNTSGKLVKSDNLKPAAASGNYRYDWDASNQPSGIYLVKMVGVNIEKTLKVTKQ